MSTAYVYAPYSAYAKVWSGHAACSGGSQLVDISKYGSVGTSLKLYVNYPTVESVKVTRVDSCCGCNSDTKHAVVVELYGDDNLMCYIGSILFGHLDDPVSSYWVNLHSSYVGSLGKIVATPGGCSCYTGEHVHLEAWGAQRLVNHNDFVNQGQTPIYKWNFSGCITSATNE